MKKLLVFLILSLWAVQVHAANIALTSHGSSSALGMTTYTVVLDLVAAADGSGSFDFATDGGGVLAGLFTVQRPGTILGVKVDLGEGADTPTTLFDIVLNDGSSTLKVDLLGATGANLVVTAGTTLYVRNADGSVTFQPLTAPPVLDITNAGDGKKATFTFVIAR
jgi:hypothetical protein